MEMWHDGGAIYRPGNDSNRATSVADELLDEDLSHVSQRFSIKICHICIHVYFHYANK